MNGNFNGAVIGVACVSFAVLCSKGLSASECPFGNPVRVIVSGNGFTNVMVRAGMSWTNENARVRIASNGKIFLSSMSDCELSRIRFEWRKAWSTGAMYLGDAWERAYGDLEWRHIGGSVRVAPWYFLVHSDGVTDGYGVGTQPSALASWSVDERGFALDLDVRAGSEPVRLGGRTLEAVRLVYRKGLHGESAFQAGCAFCKAMCPNPRLPKEPFYGYNDWYCAYGKNTATNFLLDAEFVASCAKGLTNRPYVVMDDGWQEYSPPRMQEIWGEFESGMGPWHESGRHFGMDMKEFCERIVSLGAKPGLWYRPFRCWPAVPSSMRLVNDERYFDPSLPEMRCQIVKDVEGFRNWGFKLVKIDYLTFDVCRQWGNVTNGNLFAEGSTCWRNRNRTTAEVIKDLYGAMREAAGEDVIIIGCNALNHLAAGVFELQRVGNDTSGTDWSWTRDNGVNAIGFRMIQNRAFFAIDADCVGLAKQGAIDWGLNSQWLDLLSRSGTPLFVSWRRDLADAEFAIALRRAFELASEPRPAAEPLDWQSCRTPKRWRFSEGTTNYAW